MPCAPPYRFVRRTYLYIGEVGGTTRLMRVSEIRASSSSNGGPYLPSGKFNWMTFLLKVKLAKSDGVRSDLRGAERDCR